MKTIESAINQALAGQDYEDLIVLDDGQVDKDLFIEIMFKFFAVLRYEIYNKIQMYWKANKDDLMIEFNARKAKKKEAVPGTQDLDNPSSDEEENPIDDQIILKLAQEIQSENI